MACVALTAPGWLWWRAWSPLVAHSTVAHFAHSTVAHFAWQAWHLVTSTCLLCGRPGTWWHRRTCSVASGGALHRVAGMALGDVDTFCLAGVALWHWAGSGLGAAAVCVAGVAHWRIFCVARGAWWHRHIGRIDWTSRDATSHALQFAAMFCAHAARGLVSVESGDLIACSMPMLGRSEPYPGTKVCEDIENHFTFGRTSSSERQDVLVCCW